MNLYKEAEGYIEDVKLPIADKKALIMLMSSFAECTFNKITEANNQSPPAGRAGGEAVVGRITNLIPTTWLDPLLNGENAVIGDPPYDCTDIEKLLLAIKERIIKSA